jgi:hypothetical protein
VIRDAGRRAAAALQFDGHVAMEQAGNRLRHEALRGLEQQVVRERAVMQDARRFELRPGQRQVHRMTAQHVGRQLGIEVQARDGRHPQQAQRWLGQGRKAQLDRLRHLRGRRQVLPVGATAVRPEH